MRSAVLLLFLPCFLSQSCNLPDPTDNSSPNWEPSDMCTTDSFAEISVPGLRNLTNLAGNIVHDCGIVIMLDLDQRLTTRDDYLAIQQFMKGMINTCQSRGVGHLIIFNKLFDDYATPASCCDGVPCGPVVDNLPYDHYVGMFTTTDTVQADTDEADFSLAFLQDAKQLSQPPSVCLYNTIVLLTNRIFNSTQEWDDSVIGVEDYSCETLTIIGIGNSITDELLSHYYSKVTTYLFTVTDPYCLPQLSECIKPCGPKKASECQKIQDAGNCGTPTTQPPTTTVVTTSTTENPVVVDSWQMIYLFALSNRTTSNDFQNAIKYIEEPLKQCLEDKVKIAIRFLARDNNDSGWLTDDNSIHSHLEGLKTDEVLLDASPTIDIYDNVTLTLILSGLAIHVEAPPSANTESPRLVLLTDFVSQTFIDAYNAPASDLAKDMVGIDFYIYCFDESAAQIYKNKTNLRKNYIQTDPGFSTSKSYQVGICKKQTSLPVIMLIIVGTCVGVMVILILITILYRQKYMWSEKLNKFKTSQSGKPGEKEEDVIDYWELSWEKLIVKNERLGHGAYGQVFKGKLIGPSPGIEKFYRSEVGQYTDCDCAVKMLPRYASENAKTEFMHEIHLMKTLGINDNIVNMLGCITAGKSCLVLEYCSNRDLLRYLKQKKVELEISKSMDDQIELTKELLHLAWQVAGGMSFLGDKNIIHRDLAARNILISGLEGLKNAKIGDFGLAMSATPGENALSASGRLPIKWLALESLQKEQFSFKSDVWSFGIVLFEMYSMGEIPFESVEPIELIPHLLQGNRPKPPLITPDKISDMMLQCWDKNPESRPFFRDMRDTLMTLLEQTTEGYGYLALLKTSENYRVISEVQEEDRSKAMDDFYADGPPGMAGHPGPSADIVSLSSGKTSNHSRIDIDIRVSRRQSRIRSKTFEDSDSDSDGGDNNEAEESVETWAAKVRRRKSQLANLNPFRKIASLARSTSKGRTGSV